MVVASLTEVAHVCLGGHECEGVRGVWGKAGWCGWGVVRGCGVGCGACMDVRPSVVGGEDVCLGGVGEFAVHVHAAGFTPPFSARRCAMYFLARAASWSSKEEAPARPAATLPRTAMERRALDGAAPRACACTTPNTAHHTTEHRTTPHHTTPHGSVTNRVLGEGRGRGVGGGAGKGGAWCGHGVGAQRQAQVPTGQEARVHGSDSQVRDEGWGGEGWGGRGRGRTHGATQVPSKCSVLA